MPRSCWTSSDRTLSDLNLEVLLSAYKVRLGLSRRVQNESDPKLPTGQVSATLGNVSRVADDLEGLAKREIALAKREKALLWVQKTLRRL
jgi:hypothetical protein